MALTEARLKAIERGVAFLIREQSPLGCFPLAASAANPPRIPVDNLFATASILLSAGHWLDFSAIKRAIEFIVNRRRRDGLWAWLPTNELPPDADTTACCLAACARFSSVYVGPGDAVVLRRFWRVENGPFKTWLGEGHWESPERDDAVVNCNVLLALQSLGVQPSEAERSAATKIVAAGTTPYYCSSATVAYAARRGNIPVPQRPIALTRSLDDPRALNSLVLAQQVPDIRSDDSLHISRLLQLQEGDGGWPFEPWFHDQCGCYGSRPLTTALAIEAIGLGRQE